MDLTGFFLHKDYRETNNLHLNIVTNTNDYEEHGESSVWRPARKYFINEKQPSREQSLNVEAIVAAIRKEQ